MLPGVVQQHDTNMAGSQPGAADMDGQLPIDYLLGNTNDAQESSVRALKMLLFVNHEVAVSAVHPTELHAEPGDLFRISKQCPGTNWCKLWAVSKGVG